MAKKKIETDNRLLEQVRFIRLAQRKRGDELSTHCAIRYGMIVAFDRVIAAGAPILETELDCCPQSEHLLWALEQCGSYSITQSADGLTVRSDAFTGVIPVCEPAKLATPTPDPAVAPLGDAFRAALMISGSLVRESAPTLLQSCVQIDAGACIATDGSVILQAWHGFDMPPGLLVPKSFVDALVKTRKSIVSFGYSAETFTVQFADQSWLRTNLYREKVLDMTSKLRESEQTQLFPKQFFGEAENVAKWSEDGRVYIFENAIRSHKISNIGAVQSSAMPELRQGISYSASALKQIAKHALSFDAEHDYITMFYGINLRGAIVHELMNAPAKLTPLPDPNVCPSCKECPCICANRLLELTICDVHNPKANMYGFLPCPRCGDIYRVAYQDKPGIVECDNCGIKQRFINDEDIPF